MFFMINDFDLKYNEVVYTNMMFFHRVASDGDIDHYADLKYNDMVYTSMMFFHRVAYNGDTVYLYRF